MRTHERAPHTKPTGKAAKSRLFWELKAEQVLNSIFEQHSTIHELGSSKNCSTEVTDLEIINFAPARGQDQSQREADTKISRTTRSKPWLALSLTSMGAMALIAIVQTNAQQHALEEANKLGLLNQLRQDNRQEKSELSKDPNNSHRDSYVLPPSPPSEEWMQELAKLPASEGNHPELIKVPLNISRESPQPIQAQNAPTTRSANNSNWNSLPLLLGVIQGVGKSGAAILQWEGNATSYNSGETIGTSGWHLREAKGESAVIERGGQQQRKSINSGN